MSEKDQLIEKYGQKYKKLIESALEFLDKREPEWGITINRSLYIQEIFKKQKREKM